MGGVVGGCRVGSSRSGGQATEQNTRRPAGLFAATLNSALEQDLRAVTDRARRAELVLGQLRPGLDGTCKSDQTIRLWLISRAWAAADGDSPLPDAILAVRLDAAAPPSTLARGWRPGRPPLFAMARGGGAQDAIPDREMLDDLKMRLK